MSVEKINFNGFDKLIAGRINRRVTLAALLVISTVALYRWILAPYGGQLLAAQKYDFVLASVLRKASILSTTLEKKKAKLQELTAQAETLQNELFTPDQLRAFFTSLPGLANSNGCAIQSINSPSEKQNNPVSDKGIIEKRAVVTVIGGYANIMALIKDLQTGRQKVWIDSVRMDTGGSPGKLKCQLTLTLYCADNIKVTSYE